MKTEIYLVRHAHSVFNLEEERTRELSEQGWKDAGRITELLRNENIDYLVSSPYVRAIQTIQGLADELKKEILVDERFKESTLASNDYHFENPFESMKHAFENPTFSYPGGETTNEIKERGIAALYKAIEDFKGKRIAIGIHGYIMTSILHYFDNKYDLDFWKTTTKPDIYKMTFENNKLLEVKRLWKVETPLV